MGGRDVDHLIGRRGGGQRQADTTRGATTYHGECVEAAGWDSD